MNQTHWHTRVKHWNNITPPLRPHTDSIQTQVEIIGKDSKKVLVLGVTPELTAAFDNVVAIDREQVMIDNFWPGDTENKKVIHGNWFGNHYNDGPFTGIVGDGSFNMVYFPDDFTFLIQRLLANMAENAVAAVRVFSRPESTISIEDVVAAQTSLPWHAWRCYLNMYIAQTEGVNIPSKRMLERFNELFPDRQALCDKTGWSSEEISNSMDSYKNSPTSTSYPTRQQWLDSFPTTILVKEKYFVNAGSYPLAEYYPILVFRT